MTDFAKEIISINIEEELKNSYLDYAMSVIVGRALPDVRDGLKPVHRRVLFAMSELGNDWNKPYKKSARIVGDVIGKYHPHGDTAVYDTIVRMAQPFSLRYMLIDGQGNFGSIDGDSPAAMRYTEIRMSKFAHSLLADLDKETVEFVPNYDETELAPTVLPTRIPNLLVNGSSGIAVGMATNVPPHNLNEVINACLALIDNPDLTIKDLIEYIPGPDFPTAGIINGRAGILEAYQTGRGRIYLRARTSVEGDEESSKQAIIIHELPYQVNKARLLEKIGELVKDKKIEGITAIRDESDKEGMRVVIELRRGENAEVVQNNLFAHTQMETVFGINIVALDQGQPRILNLKELLEAFIQHRREVVTRRSVYELRKARERAHILEGLGVALFNIDRMITIIKASKTSQEAKEQLLAITWPVGEIASLLERTDSSISRPGDLAQDFGLVDQGYRLSPAQAHAILELRLHRLTGLEQEKIFSEYEGLLKQIIELLEILSNPVRLMQVIREELNEILQEFGDKRRTEIIDSKEVLSLEDLISKEEVVVTLSHLGYAKTQSLDAYHAQRRGGRGKSATQVKQEDFISNLLIANTHDYILCFSNRGKVYWLKVYQIPQASRISLGRPLVNLLPLENNERISTILSVREFLDDNYITMVTSQGIIKKVSLKEFSRPRTNGIIALGMAEGDDLVGVSLTDGNQDIMLFSDTGKVIRFHEREVRSMGRLARGVRGMRLQEGQRVIALIVAKVEGAILTATENGFGKRTLIEEYRTTGRGGQGVISIQVNERNGKVVGAVQVGDEDEILLISNRGTLVRTRVSEVSLRGRNTQGVRLINLSNDEKLVGIQPVVEKLIANEVEILESDDTD
jgi:DNA gyrase subunit A